MSASADSSDRREEGADQGDTSQPEEKTEAATGGDSTSDTGQAIQECLARLDNEYKSLSEKENALLQAHAQLQKEEASLAGALALAEDQAKPPQRPRRQEDEAAMRLEDALMVANDTTDDDESTRMSGPAYSIGSFMDKSLPSFKKDDDPSIT